jgi:hypothetical protein
VRSVGKGAYTIGNMQTKRNQQEQPHGKQAACTMIQTCTSKQLEKAPARTHRRGTGCTGRRQWPRQQRPCRWGTQRRDAASAARVETQGQRALDQAQLPVPCKPAHKRSSACACTPWASAVPAPGRLVTVQ